MFASRRTSSTCCTFTSTTIRSPFFRGSHTPFITTLHGRLDLPEHQPLFATFPTLPVISISNAQRRPVPHAGWVRTIHHGLPEKLLTPQPVKPSYFAFLGRIAPEKRVDRAIHIARETGVPLKIAAKVDRADRDYFEENIKALIDGTHVEYIGEITDAEKSEFLSGAHGAAGSDRLARAVRPGDDRSLGLRHSGHCISTGVRCRR